MALREKLYTVDEFLKIARAEENQAKRLELLEGVIVELPLASQSHSALTMRIASYLSAFVDEHDLGFVTGPGVGYQLTDNTIQRPDISFISKGRHSKLSGTVFPEPPDLAVEVICPDELYTPVARKLWLYQTYGTRIIWVVDLKYRVITVRLLSGKIQSLQGDDMLDGGDVLPGFTLPVRDIFRV